MDGRMTIGHGHMEIFAVAAQGDKAGKIGKMLTRKTAKCGIGQGARHLPRAVGAKIHEYRHIAILHGNRRTYDGSLNELVILTTRISLLQTFRCGGGAEFGMSLRYQIVGGLHTLPAVVAIHCVVAADDGGDATDSQLSALVLHRL